MRKRSFPSFASFAALLLPWGTAVAHRHGDPIADIRPILDDIRAQAGQVGFVSSMVQQLRRSADDDEKIRLVHILAQIAPSDPGVVAALTQALASGGWLVRMNACYALAEAGPAAVAALPAVFKAAMESGDTDVRRACREAKERIYSAASSNRPASDFLPYLPEALETVKSPDRSWVEYDGACTVLGLIGPQAYEARPHILAMLMRRQSPVCAEALQKIGKVGGYLPEPGKP